MKAAELTPVLEQVAVGPLRFAELLSSEGFRKCSVVAKVLAIRDRFSFDLAAALVGAYHLSSWHTVLRK